MEKSGHRKHAENSGAALAFDTRMRYNDKAMKELSLALLRDPSLKDLPQRIEAGLLPALVSGLSPVHRPLLAAALYESLGFPVFPAADEERYDIIEAVTLGSAERVVSFCRGIQKAAPVDSFVRPEPWDMPGYDDPVVMAAGAFISGASIELSADGPIREPYNVYFQGGLTWPSAKLGILSSLGALYEDGLAEL